MSALTLLTCPFCKARSVEVGMVTPSWVGYCTLCFAQGPKCPTKAEAGTSLHAAGWRLVGQAGGGSWNRKGRPRVDDHPIQKKLRWEAA